MISSLSERAGTFLEKKNVTVIILIIAVIGRAIQVLFFHSALFDQSFQVTAMQNFVEGHGISLATVAPSDLSSTIYTPLVNWPPGYSILLAPFYILSGKNALFATLSLDLMAATAIIIYSRKIMVLLGARWSFINLYTILAGFFIYYFYFIGSSDGIAIAFYLMAIYYALRIIKTQRRPISAAVGIGCCLFIAASIKYLFYPLVFIIPIFLLAYGFYNRLSLIKKVGACSLAILVIGIGFLLWWQSSTGGSAGYISATGRGFFPEHILDAHPFLPGAFITNSMISKLGGGSEHAIMNFLRLVHVVTLFVLIVIAARAFIKKGLKNITLSSAFLYLGLLISLAISVLLLVLSVRVEKEEIVPGYFWTYIQDPRYYGLAEILIHITVFILYLQYRKGKPKPVQWLFVALLLLLIPETLRGIVFDCRRMLNAGKEKFYWQQDLALQHYAQSIIQKKKDSLLVKKVVVTSTSTYISSRVSGYSRIPMLNDAASLLNFSSVNTKESLLLLVILPEKDTVTFNEMLSAKGTELAGNYNGFYFYSCYVTAH